MVQKKSGSSLDNQDSYPGPVDVVDDDLEDMM